MSNSYLVLLVIIYLLSFFGTLKYRKFATNQKILAYINVRTLHKKPIPSGGGIIFASVFILGMLFLYLNKTISSDLFLVFGVGSLLAAVIGYIDDLTGIKAKRKFLLQIFLASWILYFFNGGPLNLTLSINGTANLIISIFLLVWLTNVYNFIDGIDGFAITASMLILITLLLTFVLTNHNSMLLTLFLFLLFSCLGFLFFNWPRATIFMGDSGSIFLGYCFGALIIYSLVNEEISLYTWIVVLGYYLGDTTTTTLLRIFLVKKWYGAHRSHAYQNLARVLDSHIKVTSGVIIYHLIWIMPLSVWTVLKPDFALIAVLLAFLPTVLWTVRFGPLFSKF